MRTLLILQVMKRTPDLDNLDEMFENSVNSAGNETSDVDSSLDSLFENSVNSAGNETDSPF